jgi:anaerobic ribonucleoside-triphosphate reductase activating protein
MSTDTWAVPASSVVDVREVLDWLAELPVDAVDGVTITGGEPTDQPAALAALLTGIEGWRRDRELDVLLFTGREPGWVREHPEVTAGADAVVAGPYHAEEAGHTPLRGSDNQELILLTPRGERAYHDLTPLARRQLQVEVGGSGLWIIGIPLPGDLEALDDLMAGEPGAARTAVLRHRSWQH